jgi:hypothetical protein
MDLRFVAFDLIARDSGLRALLVNYADRVEYGHPPDGTATDSCFLALKWTGNDPRCAPAEPQLLTARVHMPCHRSSERLFLDFVLERVRAALAVGAAHGLIMLQCVETSREVTVSEVDTIYKTSTFEISPATRQRSRAALLELAPWTAGVDPGGAGVIAPSGAPASMN